MRLWSIHPKYLDTQGLIALWRETLLAKKVLQNKTKGYKNHPQLIRFKNHSSPLNAINIYLREILEESKRRNFKFDSSKIGSIRTVNKISVSSGQIQFEFECLLNKLKERDKIKYNLLKDKKRIETHPLFRNISGEVERWEKMAS
ncbi:MAG: pyrimidine dimer DNA glycosylase/endonuclease V [Pseudomonadota bacterium]